MLQSSVFIASASDDVSLSVNCIGQCNGAMSTCITFLEATGFWLFHSLLYNLVACQ